MFDDICARILSPPKFKYSMYDLGSTIGKYGKRTDFIVYNRKGFKMNCSLYEPHQVKHHRTCVIYLHSMNGSRLQGLVYSQLLLQQGVSYCTFDFSACGNSTGDKISFGASEKFDVQLVIKKLKQTFYLNKFILWGRSMGAVSAVKYAQLCYDKLFKSLLCYQKGEILGLVLDSAFKSLSQLLIQIGHTQTDIPRFLIKAGYYLIKNTLQENGQFNIQQLDLISNSNSQGEEQSNDEQSSSTYPLSKVKALQLPILFLASKEDKTVQCQHSIDMYNAYDSQVKHLAYFKGLHNESREQDYLEKVMGFVRKLLNNQNQNGNKQTINIKNSCNSHNKSQRSFIVETTSKKGRTQSMELSLGDLEAAAVYHQPQALSLSSHRSSSTKTHPPTVTINTINTQIPDPLSLPRPPHKPTLLQLIQSSLFKSSNSQGTETLIQTESIQQTCLCTMTFDNTLQLPLMAVNNSNNNKHGIINTTDNNVCYGEQQLQQQQKNKRKRQQQNMSQSYYDNNNIREKDDLVRSYNWRKHLEGKPNFNCDRISLKKDMYCSN